MGEYRPRDVFMEIALLSIWKFESKTSQEYHNVVWKLRMLNVLTSWEDSTEHKKRHFIVKRDMFTLQCEKQSVDTLWFLNWLSNSELLKPLTQKTCNLPLSNINL